MLPSTIILAGGKGARARAYLGDTPKFLAPIGRSTVAGYLLPWLRSFNPQSVSLLLTAGCGDEAIMSHLSHNFVDATYVDWGADGTLTSLRRTMRFLRYSADGVLLLNGDTLLDADLVAAYAQHRRQGALVTEVIDPLTGVSSGCRFFSEATFRLALRSSQSQVEDAIPLLCSPMIYPARTFVDIGTREGWEEAQKWTM
jgi:NDP-sugar pyrophosphorylase family protein